MIRVQHLQLYEVMALKTKMYFVIERAKCRELFHKVGKGRLKEDAARIYFQHLINAVEFCQQGSETRELSAR
ncbi:CBL-interacting protein kinase 2 [Linum perenne]